jgi:hypothetical protein
LTARFVDADAATGENLESILKIETEELGAGAEHDAGELSVSVFKGEVEMAAGRGATIGDFAFDADVEEALFDVAGESGDELADGPGARSRRGGRFRGCIGDDVEREERLGRGVVVWRLSVLGEGRRGAWRAAGGPIEEEWGAGHAVSVAAEAGWKGVAR